MAGRLVRTGASHCGTERNVFSRSLCEHALVDSNAGALGALGQERTHVHLGCAEIRSAERGRDGRTLAHLLRKYFQSCASENQGDAEGNAEALLEEFARD